MESYEEEEELIGGFDDLFGDGGGGLSTSYTTVKKCNYAKVDSDEQRECEEDEVEMAGGFDDLFGGDCGDCCYHAKKSYKEDEEVELAGGFDDLFGGGCSHHAKKSYKEEEEVELAGGFDDACDKKYEKPSHQHESSVGYSLMNLIKLQMFDGHWDDLDKINEMLNLNIKLIDGIDLSDKNLEKKCISTVLAVAAFHIKSQEEKNTWKMIEQKALAWLKSNLSNVDVDKIIEQAKQLIN